MKFLTGKTLDVFQILILVVGVANKKETIEYECYINKVSKLKNWFLKGL